MLLVLPALPCTAVAEADCLILLVDGKVGLQAGDREVLDWLRTHHPRKHLLLAVNKCDNQSKADLMAAEFWELGLTPHTLSAINGSGTGELLDEMAKVRQPWGECRIQEVMADQWGACAEFHAGLLFALLC
jgi:GTP-binding protein